VTEEAVPDEQRFAVGALTKLCVFAEPHTPFTTLACEEKYT
jgi:hypothetical protein